MPREAMMFDFAKLGELGAVVIVALVALGLIDLLRKKYRASAPGERRLNNMATVVECPNKIETLPTVLNNLGERLRELIVLNKEQNKTSAHASEGVDHWIRQHAAVDGVEQWKMPPDAIKTIRDSQAIQVRTLETVEKITGQNERVLRLLERKANGG